MGNNTKIMRKTQKLWIKHKNYGEQHKNYGGTTQKSRETTLKLWGNNTKIIIYTFDVTNEGLLNVIW